MQALSHSNLASVRGDGLAALPEAERAAWQALWTRIERVLGK